MTFTRTQREKFTYWSLQKKTNVISQNDQQVYRKLRILCENKWRTHFGLQPENI